MAVLTANYFFGSDFMNIKIYEKSIEEVLAIPKKKHKRPIRPNMFWRSLMRLVSSFDLKKTHFSFDKVGMDRLGKNENYESFLVYRP